ncbi:hypothetical protein GCM10027174_25370 [Salinifilum aidingensis]
MTSEASKQDSNYSGRGYHVLGWAMMVIALTLTVFEAVTGAFDNLGGVPTEQYDGSERAQDQMNGVFMLIIVFPLWTAGGFLARKQTSSSSFYASLLFGLAVGGAIVILAIIGRLFTLG